MSEDDFELQRVGEQLTRIELPALEGVGEPLARPVNVYLVEGASPTLINAGHPAAGDALGAALRTRGVTPAEIERIIATSWHIDVLGGATHFPRADLFALSPDMTTPRDLEMVVDSRRQQLIELAERLAANYESFRIQPIRRAVERFFPRMTRNLRFAPLRNGHFVQAGQLRLEVLATGGPAPGHLAVFCADEQLLFCGDFTLGGLPKLLEDTQAYLVSLERLAELPSNVVLPNSGRIWQQGRWTMSRAANFLNNFLTNVPAALVRTPTVIEFIERDRGYTVDEPIELLVAYRRFRRLFDELVRTRTIAAEGEGLQRRYGVDVEDPRKKVRRYEPSPDSQRDASS